MNYSKFTRFLAMLLVAVMVIGYFPAAAFATEAESEGAAPASVQEKAGSKLYDTSVSGEYFKVIEEKVYDLAPGAQEYGFTLNNAAGSDRKLVHVFAVDTKNEDIQVMPGYYGIDKLDPDNLPLEGVVDKSEYWKAMELSKTVKYYENMGYNVVGAMNTALAYDSNAPYGYMVWNGVVLGTPEVHKGAQTYLAIDKEGNCELRSMSTPLNGSEQTAISANFNWLVKDGKLHSYKTVERTSSDASRSMIGIKADGTLIFCHVDGRQGDKVSGGLSNYEMGEMMLALGCVNAVNCDGGGSSTFISKRPTDDTNVMRSIPSDGAERPTINSVILVSTAGASGVFDKVVFDSEYEYIAPGASTPITVIGKDTKQFTMDVPADVTYQVAEADMGTIVNGVYTAGSKTGIATIQAIYNGAVVGEMALNVVTPDEFGFTADETVLPYGKSMEVEVVGIYGADSWDVCLNGAYTLALSNENAATLDGFTLTATKDESIAGVNVTVTYLPDASMTDVLTVTYGKGSEIIYDFEDGDTAGFMGFQDAKQWSIDNGVNNTLVGSDPLAGQFSEQVSSKVTMASVENGGQVKNGNYALAWSADYSNSAFASWTYNVLFNVGETIVLRDVANGKNATTLGMWLYIPEGATGLAFQSQFYAKNADGTYTCKQAHFTFTTVSGVVKNLNAATEADIPESRWVYASINLTPYDYLCTPVATDTSNSRSPSFIRTYVKPNSPAIHTFYIDDITLDYSSAVEDRVLPTITGVSYATQDTAIELTNGGKIDGNSITFSAEVADNQGLDTATAQILVDGVALNTSVSGKVMSAAEVTLTSGTHTVSFEISDKLGNLARVTRTFTVSGDATITLAGHNDSGLAPEYDSIYYVDLKAADMANLNGLTATLKLQNANDWEPENLIVAPGFVVTDCSVNSYSNELTITLVRESAMTARTDVLVSIPVRLWSWTGVDSVTGKPIAPETWYKSGNCPVVTIDCKVVYGKAEYADGAFGAFGGDISVATKLNDVVYPWHYHDSELTVLNQEATCTVDGYENRTYCETCKSVVDWGTKLEATGHTYAIVGDELVCHCGDVLGGNGLVTANGKIYILIAGKLVSGWQNVDNKWVYADPTTMEVCTGEFTVNKLTYTADEAGYVVKGAWVTDAKGTKYSYGPQFCKREWVEIDGAKYYFGTDYYMYTGLRFIVVNRNNAKEGWRVYKFAEDGKLLDEMLDANGIIASDIDGIFYVENGKSVYGGLMKIGNDYYYARTSGQLVVNATYWITKTNDLLPAANYTFGADGKMVNPPVTEEPEQPDVPDVPVVPEKKNGIIEEGGKLWWYVDDVKTYGGLMKIGDDYYYARSSGEILTNTKYWITKTNDLLPAANYPFGADGKMVNPPA